MQNAYNPKPNENFLANGSLSINVAQVYHFWNAGLDVGFALVPTISHLSVKFFYTKSPNQKNVVKIEFHTILILHVTALGAPDSKNISQYPFGKGLGGSKSWSILCGEEKNPFRYHKSNPCCTHCCQTLHWQAFRAQGFSGAKSINNVE